MAEASLLAWAASKKQQRPTRRLEGLDRTNFWFGRLAGGSMDGLFGRAGTQELFAASSADPCSLLQLK
eukprot:scaffold1052_cov339-Pavlova_lutheri.AAC.42